MRARRVDELWHRGPFAAVRAELAWLVGDLETIADVARAPFERAVANKVPWLTGELGFWLARSPRPVTVPAWAAPPWSIHLAGGWRTAAREWRSLGCPYESLMAMVDGDAPAIRTAIDGLETMGAEALLTIARRRLG